MAENGAEDDAIVMLKQNNRIETMTVSPRYASIDFLRGFCVIWIIWYHTVHPDFVNYPFFNATLFFVSGIVFKPYDWNVFLKKRFNQLLVPFFFFYVIYYVFFVLLNFLKNGVITTEVLAQIGGLLKCYTYNDAFIINYPLWFVLALLNIQILTNILIKYIGNKYLIVLVAIIISLVGNYYVRTIPTPLMIGKSLPFLIYFVVGYIGGKNVLNENPSYKKIMGLLVLWGLICAIRMSTGWAYFPMMCVEIVLFSFVLLMASQIIGEVAWARWIVYYGANSYVVLGLHEIFLTILRVIYEKIIGAVNMWFGMASVIVVLIMLYLSIRFLNEYMPKCIGKKELV